jgi:hypothetical protein
MKRYFIIILIIILSGKINQSFSWDSTAAKYYPLAVGNSWSYHFINRGGNPVPCYPNSQYDYIITITSDTINNGHKYYKFSNGDKLRIDSTTMNVYKFTGSGECLFDSLLARKNDVIHGCGFLGVIGDSSFVFFAGENRKVRTTNGIGYSKKLMYGIGLYYHGGCELQQGFDQLLNGCIINGIQYGNMISGLTTINSEIPIEFNLFQNYPNPFNPATNIKFQLPKSGMAKLVVYDLPGKEIQTLVNQQLSPGTYEVDFEGSNLPSGVYFYELNAVGFDGREFSQMKKMILMK